MAPRTPPTSQELIQRVRRIATEVVRPAAALVDREARFPQESFLALKEEKLLSAAIPREFGGFGCTLPEISAMCTELGRACASTATVFAMHQIQVACIARHGAARVPMLGDFLREVCQRQLLVASGTSEVGVGGDMRSSVASIQTDEAKPERVRLEKSCSVLSYGMSADAILITARRKPDAPANDQVAVLIRKDEYQLEPMGVWDTLGLRGTCSPPFKVTAEVAAEQVLPDSFSEVASLTMVPYSHVVWSSGWLGIASDAVSIARSMLRKDARKKPGQVPFGSQRLVEAVCLLQGMRANVQDLSAEYERLAASPDGASTLSSVPYALRINNLKLVSSQLVAQICQLCLGACGVMGYSNRSEFSMGRHLRDALGAALMIANDRISATNASLLLVSKDDLF
jgi:acyl-CoA dehydrogenase